MVSRKVEDSEILVSQKKRVTEETVSSVSAIEVKELSSVSLKIASSTT